MAILDDVINALFPTRPRSPEDLEYERLKAEKSIDAEAIGREQQAEAERLRLIEESKPNQYPVWGAGAPNTDKFAIDNATGQTIIDRTGITREERMRHEAAIMQREAAEQDALDRLHGYPVDSKTGKRIHIIEDSRKYMSR